MLSNFILISCISIRIVVICNRFVAFFPPFYLPHSHVHTIISMEIRNVDTMRIYMGMGKWHTLHKALICLNAWLNPCRNWENCKSKKYFRIMCVERRLHFIYWKLLDERHLKHFFAIWINITISIHVLWVTHGKLFFWAREIGTVYILKCYV